MKEYEVKVILLITFGKSNTGLFPSADEGVAFVGIFSTLLNHIHDRSDDPDDCLSHKDPLLLQLSVSASKV